MTSLEELLARMYSRHFATLAGSGTIGLIAAIRALNLVGKRVAIPNNVCISVPQAVIYAGSIPVYLDVEIESLGLNPDLIIVRDNIAAVIAVHSYGRMCKIEQLENICKRKGIYLIEDFSVAQGASGINGPAGSYGDISVTSFGTGKIIDIGHGGAVFTDNEILNQKIQEFLLNLADPTTEKHEQTDEVMKLQKATYNKEFLVDQKVNPGPLKKIMKQNRENYFVRWDNKYGEKLEMALKDLSGNILRRRLKANYFISRLFGISGIEIMNYDSGDVYWRFNILVADDRNELFMKLLEDRFPVSSWYPSVSCFVSTSHKEMVSTPNSDLIGDQIINLWVNDEIDESYLNNVCEKIISINLDGDY